MTETPLPPAIVVTGPTGSGKSELALEIAEAFTGTIINADAMQVYRELRVLTARPSPADEARVPHRLYGCLSAAERCSVGRWLEMACAVIAEARTDGRTPVVVGGTGLYINALIHGISPIPDIPDDIRSQVQDDYERLGGIAFRAALAALDPGAASRLPAHDRLRLARAMEVVIATGRTLAEWQTANPPKPALAARFTTLAVLPERQQLYARLDQRFDRMLTSGAIKEVSEMLALKLDARLPAMKALGVRELASHIAGKTDIDTARSMAKQMTRRYAKRQITWIRHQLSGHRIISDNPAQDFCEKAISIVRASLLTPDA
ncbi:MAG: tRNA (adenosine(37)-N6)-dimethylallyltransferase MiaA [Hyphomicrobiales bacterium]|nr:tRNA (adenosine(37)-N6)-dimethylallyltransferase MiaA [Hyphomicrobiales bacterium]